jgi:hypothetical protein
MKLLVITVLMTSVALAGSAHAGPTITNYNYWPNEVGASSQYKATQTAPADWYLASTTQ